MSRRLAALLAAAAVVLAWPSASPTTAAPTTVAPPAAVPSAASYVEQAVALYSQGQCSRAVTLLRRAIALDPRYVRAYTWLGFCYARLGRHAEALAAFNRVVALAPRSEDARLARAWIQRLQARPRPSPAARPAATASATPSAVVPLVSLPAVAGVTDANRPRQVQLFGVIYGRALVERRNWWQGRRAAEREWRVVYNLQRRYTRFRAVAGIEDGSPQEFTAVFVVRADGTTLFEGRPKRAGDVPDTIDVDVTGALQLELLVQGRDPLHTRDLSVVWADPTLDTRPASTQPLPGPAATAPSPAGPAPASPPGPGPGVPSPPAVPAPTPPATVPAPTPTPGGSRVQDASAPLV